MMLARKAQGARDVPFIARFAHPARSLAAFAVAHDARLFSCDVQGPYLDAIFCAF
jgi:hypothetical protein